MTNHGLAVGNAIDPNIIIEISGGVDLARLHDVRPFSQRVRISLELLIKAILPIDLSFRILG
jgi:nicotinate-nucleotide pyrophosphorylase